jgi:hypothetical protein
MTKPQELPQLNETNTQEIREKYKKVNKLITKGNHMLKTRERK